MITGHSLGGGLASLASLSTNIIATTFNAAGLHSSVLSAPCNVDIYNAINLIKAYIVEGEIVDMWQSTTQWGGLSQRALGYWIELEATSIDPIFRHLTHNYMMGLLKKYSH
jgi:putative lipase involved disintegration of autophagic bodies